MSSAEQSFWVVMFTVIVAGGLFLLAATYHRASKPVAEPCRPALLSRPTGATSVVCPDARHRLRMVEGEITCACEEAKR